MARATQAPPNYPGAIGARKGGSPDSTEHRREHRRAGTSNTNLGAAKYEFGGPMYFAFFTVNTAKYSPKYFRICKYGSCLAFLYLGAIRGEHVRAAARSIGAALIEQPGLEAL